MSKGEVTTTRAQGEHATLPSTMHKVIGRNATEADLEVARQQYIGKRIPIEGTPLRYFCENAQLDELRRLVLVLEREDALRRRTVGGGAASVGM